MRTRWEKYGALGGVAFVVLGVIGGFLAGEPPEPDASAADVVTYFDDNAGKIQTSQVLLVFASIGLLWWFGSLYRRMARAEGEMPRHAIIAGLGLLWSLIFYLVSNAIAAAVAMRIDDVGEGARFFWALTGVLAATSAVGTVTLLGAVGVLTIRNGLFPRWVAYVGWLAGVAFLIGSFGAGSDATFFFVVGGLVAFLIWVVWILATSWYMWSEEIPAG